MLSLTQYDDALGLNFKFFAHNSKVILDRIKIRAFRPEHLK